MARQNLRKVVQGVSSEHTALGEYLDDGADFIRYPSDPQNPVFPTGQNVQDTMVGDGKPYDKQSKRQFFDPINIAYQGLLNSTMGVRLFRDWLGGAITETTNTVPATKDSAITQKAAGSVPLLSNFLRAMGGASFLHGDCFVQTLEISQEGASQARISGTIMNSGYFAKITDTNIDVADVIALPAYLKNHGVKTRLNFSDGVDSYDFANEGRLLNVGFTGNQNVIVENLPADPFVDTDLECQGAYSKNVYIDVQQASMRAKVYGKQEDFDEFDSWLAQRKLTSVSLIFKSCEKIGATTHNWELEIKFPVAEFNLTPDQQGNFSAFNIDIKAIEGDNVTGSLVLGRVRQVGSIDA